MSTNFAVVGGLFALQVFILVLQWRAMRIAALRRRWEDLVDGAFSYCFRYIPGWPREEDTDWRDLPSRDDLKFSTFRSYGLCLLMLGWDKPRDMCRDGKAAAWVEMMNEKLQRVLAAGE